MSTTTTDSRASVVDIDPRHLAVTQTWDDGTYRNVHVAARSTCPATRPRGTAMTTIEHEITSETLPPVDCTSWCDQGDGHTDAGHPHDQFCTSEGRRVTLSRYPLIEFDRDTSIRDYLLTHLYREAGAAATCITIDHNDTPLIELTLNEAEQLAAALVDLVKAARE